MEIQISSFLPFGPINVILLGFPALFESSESPQRETQLNVWPSFAGLAFSRKADLKGFLSGFPKLLRQSGAEAVLGPMIEWKAELQQAGGFKRLTPALAVFRAVCWGQPGPPLTDPGWLSRRCLLLTLQVLPFERLEPEIPSRFSSPSRWECIKVNFSMSLFVGSHVQSHTPETKWAWNLDL